MFNIQLAKELQIAVFIFTQKVKFFFFYFSWIWPIKFGVPTLNQLYITSEFFITVYMVTLHFHKMPSSIYLNYSAKGLANY